MEPLQGGSVKTGIIIKNTVYLLSVNLVLWITLYFMRGSVPTQSPVNIALFLFAVLLQSMWATYAFSDNFAFHFKDKQTHKKFLLLLAISLLGEIAVNFAALLPISYRHFVIDLLVAGVWVVAYVAATRNNKRLVHRRTAMILCTVGLGIILACCAIGDGVFVEQYQKSAQKYTADSPYLIALVKNSEFLLSIKSCLANLLIGIIFLLTHIGSLPAASDTEESGTRRVGKSVLQANFIFLGALLVALASLALPIGKAMIFRQVARTTATAYLPQSEMNFSSGGMNVYSDKGEHDASDTLYQARTVKLEKPSVGTEIFRFIGAEPQVIFTNGGNLYAKLADHAVPHCVKFTVGENSAYVYGNYAIAYYEQGQAHIVRLKELNRQTYSEVLSGVLLELLADGNLFVLEYGGEYLLQYHADFVRPYIDRYRNASFTETEKQWIAESYYNASYIVDIAGSLD